MTKQEEIREGIIGILAKLNCRTLATPILQYLHSQGVVIKVEGELPKEICDGCSCYFKEKDKSILLERLKGYTLTEPLT